LIQNTTITQPSTYSLIDNLTGTGDFQIQKSGTDILHIYSTNSNVGINGVPTSTQQLLVGTSGPASIAIVGQNTATSGTGTGIGILGSSIQSGGYGVEGASSNFTGYGVYANNQSGVTGAGLKVNGTSNLMGVTTLGTGSSVNGSLIYNNSTNVNTVAINSGATSASYSLTLPTAVGIAGQALTINSIAGTTATMGWTTVGAANTWNLTGNTGTTPGTNFVGTTDQQSLYLKVYGNQAGYLQYTATAANSNTTFGYTASAANSSTAIGAASNASGTGSLAVGNSAAGTGNYSTAIGTNASSASSNSVAVGYGAATGIGNYNTMIGSNTSTNSSYSVGIGYLATANSNNSVSIGYQTTASSQQSVSLGSNASVSGNNAIAMGYQAAGAYQATAVGSNSTATANQSTALGYTANAAYQATAVGSNTVATSNQSTALGYTASATGTNSTAIGYGATTSQANALVLGNSSVSVGIQTNTPQRALEVGGTGNTIRVDGLASGGTYNSSITAANSTLLYSNNSTGDIYSLPTVNSAILSTSATGVPAWTSSGATNSLFWGLSGNTGTTAGTNYIGTTDATDFVTKTSGTERMRVTNGGNVGIGTSAPGRQLSVVSNATGTSVETLQNTNAAGYSDIDFFTSASGLGGSVGYGNSSVAAAGSTALQNNMFLYGSGNSLVITHSNSTFDLFVNTSGNVGIGTNSVNSTLQVNGSVAASINTQSGSYTLASTDYCVIYTGSGSTFTLPAASGCTGRIYMLVNQGTGTLNTSTIKTGNSSSITTLSTGTNVQVISDGTNWRKIN
jgi:hypothetical protein